MTSSPYSTGEAPAAPTAELAPDIGKPDLLAAVVEARADIPHLPKKQYTRSASAAGVLEA